LRTLSELEKKYKADVVPALMKEFNYGNPMQVPNLSKIVINACVSEAVQNAKILDTVAKEIADITGQKPVITRAKKAISNFKLRQGQPIGCRVTLRKRLMWEFLYRLINVSLPRVRDFRGVSAKAFDNDGNYTLGIKEQIIFPEINFDNVSKVYGLNVSLVTTAKTTPEAKSLLKNLGVPFRN